MVTARVRRFLTQYGISPGGIVVAASAGVDSTALLMILASLREEGWSLTCGHVNHHLRGAESDEDERFVRTLCERLGLPLVVADGVLDAERIRAVGTEAAAREIRYRRLAEIREGVGALWIATAHQKDDQAETVLMRLITGGGIAALRGIQPVRSDGVIRPLLDVTRDEIEAFLREQGVEARADSSNRDPRFLRNRVRPIIRELGAIENLAAVAAQARSQWTVLEQVIDDAEAECAEIDVDSTRFIRWPADQWLRQALLHRHIRRLDPKSRDVSARDLERIAAEIPGIRRLTVTKTLELVRKGDALVLRRPPEEATEFEVELAEGRPAYVPELGLTVYVRRSAPHPAFGHPSLRSGQALLPASGEKGIRGAQLFELPSGAGPTFTVRNRRDGDRFEPLGLPSPKKLKDFLIDRKIEADTRDRLPLLLWNGEIVWVAGVEISERFKVHSPPRGDVYEVWIEDETGIHQ